MTTIRNRTLTAGIDGSGEGTRLFARRRAGASGISLAILIGLVSVVAINVVSQTGEGVVAIFGNVASSLPNGAAPTTGNDEDSGEPGDVDAPELTGASVILLPDPPIVGVPLTITVPASLFEADDPFAIVSDVESAAPYLSLDDPDITDGAVFSGIVPSGASRTLTLTAVNSGGSDTAQIDLQPGSAGAFAWGSDNNGQLGNGGSNVETNQTPLAVSLPTGRTFVQVKGGGGGSGTGCAIDDLGDAWCWGFLPRNFSNVGEASAVTMPAGVSFGQIFVGAGNACALPESGQAYCWGSDGNGSLGNGPASTASVADPTLIDMPPGVSFAKVSFGEIHTCALATDGNGYCWGSDFNGAVGTAQPSESGNRFNSPTLVDMPADTIFTDIAAGRRLTCAIDQVGDGWCWGWNVRGGVGDGTVADRDVPTRVIMPSGVSFRSISIASEVVCAIDVTGDAWCWGLDFEGQVGNGLPNSEVTNVPTAVTMPAGVSFAQIGSSSGGSPICALDTTGDAWCWGSNFRGGVGSAGGNANEPRAVTMPPGVSFASIDMGTQFAIALVAP